MCEHTWRVDLLGKILQVAITPGRANTAKNTWFIVEFGCIEPNAKSIAIDGYRHFPSVHGLRRYKRKLRLVQQIIGKDGRADIGNEPTHSAELNA